MNAPVTPPQVAPSYASRPARELSRVLARMPRGIRDGFTPEQLTALEAALDGRYTEHPPVDIRITLFGWAYLVILGGRERRRPERQVEERKRHPLRTPGNIAFLTAVALLGLLMGNGLHWLLLGG